MRRRRLKLEGNEKGNTTFITMKKEANTYGAAGSQGTARFSLWSLKARGQRELWTAKRGR